MMRSDKSDHCSILHDAEEIIERAQHRDLSPLRLRFNWGAYLRVALVFYAVLVLLYLAETYVLGQPSVIIFIARLLMLLAWVGWAIFWAIGPAREY